MDFENFEYPDSPTQKWLADNADLSPLTVLDNINLKTEFPCAPGAAGQGRWRTEFDRARNNGTTGTSSLCTDGIRTRNATCFALNHNLYHFISELRRF